ncbi:hypothetical protein BS50DRAFT_596213 [Corynespora cassiicola Philippines]|uniref:Uncharacterized protein n=1 Tax=Corynespora cassiicola Philippines TaxID=1448308 RepID=A0A2T2PBU4_CORCC|nr:hypothetical protein BS50DRAFT_596213 [Corynespora cassiicola Philippines]
MKLFLLLQLLTATALVGAAPAPNAPVSKRADVFAVDCGGTQYGRQVVQASFNALVSSDSLPRNQKPAAGNRAYPRQYGNNQGVPSDAEVVTALNAIPGCATGQQGTKFFEFPLTDPAFTGGAQASQGPDRVIAIAPNVGPGQTRTFTYCLAVTHRGGGGMGDGSFRPCTNV